MREPATYHLTLADGRKLSYTDTGTGENGTWIHCHGIPGSRYELAHITADLNASGLRVIVPDRPGYGDSTPHPDYGFLQHTNDVRQLADHLGLDRFSVSGFSGGGVFAMATANDLEERIERLTIAATPAVPLMKNPYAYASELTGNAWKAALDNPDKLAMDLQALTESAEILSEALMGNAGPEEYEYMCSEPFLQGFRKSTQAATRQGSTESARSLARDSRLIAGQWPYRPEDIAMPTKVIHGQCDELVHMQHQRALKSHLPEAVPIILERQGHFSVISFIWN